MFLIGISGSVLPYLFVAGIALVCSMRAGDDLFNQESQDNMKRSDSGHVLFVEGPEGQGYAESFFCCSEFSWPTKQISSRNSDQIPEVGEARWKIFFGNGIFEWAFRYQNYREALLYSRLSSLLFSGLSPPWSVFNEKGLF